ncbi:MAG: hypothetical protein K940chlam7_01118 [Chlamydiae bacterium]|nr:hypothetical protein [Chlamydiota bacterium]
MKIRLLFLFLIIGTPLPLKAAQQVPITLELARTPEEKTWGLMQRTELPEDHGMLFINPHPIRATFWMFNCYLDLSVAFLDEKGTIQEIYNLKSYPERMDPLRPVNTVADLYRYPQNDPVITFFHRNRVTSSGKTTFALEMEGGWFERHEIKPGDRLARDDSSLNATIIQRTLLQNSPRR